MKKVTETSNWKRYKETDGKEVIAMFNHLTTPEATIEDMLNVIKRFDPEFARNTSKKEEKRQIEILTFYNNLIKANIPQTEEEWKDFNHGTFFGWLTHYLAVEDENVSLFDVPQIGFKNILGNNIFLSIVLCSYMPEYFIPNLFVMQFAYFKKIAEKYEMDLPKVPNRSDYRGRWLYYIDVCNAIVTFSIDNDLQDFGELCAFLFDYEMTNIKEELETDYNKPLPEIPENVWILVGNYGEGEKTMESGFWQSNAFTQRGDLMLFYEKYPVKKLNAAWRALGDGFIDPFGHFYSFSYIGQKIEIPADKALTFDDFMNNEYFKKRDSKGNFVSKKFQDVSGWTVTSKDYAEIKKMLEAKGFDTSVLPSLYEPKDFSTEEITSEDDVYNKLITPLLEQMGWKKDIDFKREIEFAAGHTTTHHVSNKRPDYCLHLSHKGKKTYAQVVIEAKEEFKNTKELADCFDQCLSYACWGKAKVLVICDKRSIYVYEQDRNGEFDQNHHKPPFRWAKMKDHEQFNELKQLLSKK